MTPYSAAAGGSFSSRESSRSAALRIVLGQLQLGELRAQLVHLGLLLVALAELLLDRLQLLAQEVLALALLHLRLDLRLDLRAELDHLELTAEDRRDRAQALLDVRGLEQLLLLLRLQAHGRGDEVGEDGRVVDVRRGELQLLGQVRDRRDDAPRTGSGRCASAPPAPSTPRRRRGPRRTRRPGTAPPARGARAGSASRPGRGSAACRRGSGSACGRPRRCRSRAGRPSPGVSTSSLRTVTRASIRSPEATSSTSSIERSWPIASGVIDCGKTTVSFSGRTGRVEGTSISSSSTTTSCSSSLTGRLASRRARS